MTTSVDPSLWQQVMSTVPTAGARIGDAAFRQALIGTLGPTGLFRSVSAEGNADYELDAVILSQKVSPKGFRLRLILTVSYKLIDMQSNRPVWSDEIVSHHDSGVRLSAAAAESEANEGAMRENLAELARRLAKVEL